MRVTGVAIVTSIAGCADTSASNTHLPKRMSHVERVEPVHRLNFTLAIDSAAQPLSLHKHSTIELGSAIDETPASIRQITFSRDRIFVVDGQSRRLWGYDANGRFLFAKGKWGLNAEELDTPMSVRVTGDSVWLLDLSHPDHLSLYSRDGNYMAGRAFPLEEGAISFELFGTHMVFATLAHRTHSGQRYALLGADSLGRIRWLGCQVAPQYESGEAQGELASRYAARIVARIGSLLLCAQPLTPVVQIYDTTGGFVGTFNRAPSYYRAAPRRATTSNVRDMERFEAEWTQHESIFPYPDGLLSVYTTFDTVSARAIHFLFLCDSSRGSNRCGEARSPGQPMSLLPPDTVVVLMPSDSAAPRTLARYIMRLRP